MTTNLTEAFHDKLQELADELAEITKQPIVIAVGCGDGEAMTACSGDFDKNQNAYCFAGMSYALSKSILEAE